MRILTDNDLTQPSQCLVHPPLGSPILAVSIVYCGLAQVIIGLMECKKNNTFDMFPFGSFGFFWFSFAAILMLPALGLAKVPDPADFTAFPAVWSLLIFDFFHPHIKMHRFLEFTLFMVFDLAVLLIAAQRTGSSLIFHLGGFSLALYRGCRTRHQRRLWQPGPFGITLFKP